MKRRIVLLAVAIIATGTTSVALNPTPAFAAVNFRIYPNPTVLTTFGSLAMTYQGIGLRPNSTYIIEDPISGIDDDPSCPVFLAPETDDRGNFALSVSAFPCEPGQSVVTLRKGFGNRAIVATFIHKVVKPRPTTDGIPCSGPRFFAAPGSRAPHPESRVTYPPALLLHYSERPTFANSFMSKTLIGECLMPNVTAASATYTVTDPACKLLDARVGTDGMGRFYYPCNAFGVPPDTTSSVMYITQNPGNNVIVRNSEVFRTPSVVS